MSARRRRLDRRNLLPRDYLVDPWRFGRLRRVESFLPHGGDDRSLAVALVQHRVAHLVANLGDRHAAAAVTRRFGFSKQQWSLCLHGEAWMGETVLAAAVWLLVDGGEPA